MNPLAWVIVIILIIAAFPTWPYSHDWGYYPSGGGLLLLLILIILITRRR